MEMIITHQHGRWLVNGKRLQDLNHDEVNYLDDFFREMKLEFELQNQPTCGSADRHIEPISCPNCMMICNAEVVHSNPWCMYEHECEHCGCTISVRERIKLQTSKIS